MMPITFLIKIPLLLLALCVWHRFLQMQMMPPPHPLYLELELELRWWGGGLSYDYDAAIISGFINLLGPAMCIHREADIYLARGIDRRTRGHSYHVLLSLGWIEKLFTDREDSCVIMAVSTRFRYILICIVSIYKTPL